MKEDNTLINDALLLYKQVRLVGDNVNEPGIYSTKEALKLAQDLELDLVCISISASPIVCRICDYEKFLYQKKRKEKEQKAKAAKVETKELKFSLCISEHDYTFKVKHAREFLQKGNRVKIFIMFSGREIKFVQQGENVMNRIISDLSEICSVEQKPKMEGRKLTMLLIPKSR